MNYNSILRAEVHYGSDLNSSKFHKISNFLSYQKNNNYVFDLNKIILNMINNKNIITRVALSDSNFLFLTSKENYFGMLEPIADLCYESSSKWVPGLIGNSFTRYKNFFEEFRNASDVIYKWSPYGLRTNFYNVFDFIILFDNNKFFSKILLSEITRNNLPVMSIFDTDSFFSHTMYPMFGNDDSLNSVYFYSFFISTCILNAKKKN